MLPILGSADRRMVRLIVMKLFSKNSNVTDRRTDGQLIMAILRSATLRAVTNVHNLFVMSNVKTSVYENRTIVANTGKSVIT